eukprot:Awhi_evm1s1314
MKLSIFSLAVSTFAFASGSALYDKVVEIEQGIFSSASNGVGTRARVCVFKDTKDCMDYESTKCDVRLTA